MNKEHIHDAMSRIKKSVARSQSIRNSDLSQISQSDEYNGNRRESPYDNPPTIGLRPKHYSDVKNLQYPEVYKSHQ